jgi:hypothetical protein
MPLIFIGAGAVFILVGLNGNAGQLYALIASDFQGPNNFIYWMIAMLLLGSLGYIKGLEHFSRLFLILVIVGLLLDKNPNTGVAAGVTFAQTFQNFVATATGQKTQG